MQVTKRLNHSYSRTTIFVANEVKHTLLQYVEPDGHHHQCMSKGLKRYPLTSISTSISFRIIYLFFPLIILYVFYLSFASVCSL